MKSNTIFIIGTIIVLGLIIVHIATAPTCVEAAMAQGLSQETAFHVCRP